MLPELSTAAEWGALNCPSRVPGAPQVKKRIEEMRFLVGGHADSGMLRQVIIQGERAAFHFADDVNARQPPERRGGAEIDRLASAPDGPCNLFNGVHVS